MTRATEFLSSSRLERPNLSYLAQIVVCATQIAYVYNKVRTQFGKDVVPALKDEPADVRRIFRGVGGWHVHVARRLDL